MAIDTLRDTVASLNTSAAALAILGAAIDASISGEPLDPRLAPHARALMDALGVRQAVEDAAAGELQALLAPIRAFSYLNGKLLTAEGRRPGWTHTEPHLLQSLGGVTHGLALGLQSDMGGQLPGLAAQLAAPDGAFLDVGVGVAKLSIEIARTFPALRVVGVDPWAPAIALARQNVALAGLQSRIELRHLGGEQLTEASAFDLAWIASVFMPEDLVPDIVAAAGRALRPGGWALLALARPESQEPVIDAVWNFRISSFGGALLTGEDGMKLLRDAGFTDVRVLASPPGAVAALAAGRWARPSPQ
jgi:SAM-dependent methyltransferase